MSFPLLVAQGTRALIRRATPSLLIVAVHLGMPVHRVLAQHGSTTAAAPALAPKEATQFDFLIGQWELNATPKATTLGQKIHGVPKLLGIWKAWRAFDGWGIEDEVRLTDGSGNPRLLTHTTRFFDTKARRWQLSAIDVYKSLITTASAEWRGTEMLASGRGTDEEGHAYLSRGVFTKISNTGFTYRLDRSTDDGKTWTEGLTTIVAKRVAATAPR